MSENLEEATDNEVSLEDKEAYRKRLNLIWGHLENVRKFGKKLADRLIDEGDLELARILLKKVSEHDVSKFSGIEWECMTVGEHEMLFVAAKHHAETNSHHPEYFVRGIKDMSEAELAEMVVDWAARSSDLGTDLREWIKTKASKRYDFSLKSPTYKKIKRFVDLVLDKFE